MIDIALDWETFYSKDYSLRKMTTREYIMDERFEVILLAAKVGDEPRVVLEPHEIRPWLAQWDWNKVRLAAHNNKFDGAILRWQHGITPKFYECTQAMGQALLGHVIGSSSLKAINEHHGRVKDTQALTNMEGLNYYQAKQSPDWERYKTYAGQDVDDCRWHLKRFRQQLAPKHRLVIHLLMNMYINGELKLDKPTLEENLVTAAAERARLLAAAGMTSPADLRSAGKFASLLEGLGVNPPRKISATTKEEAYAFAKKDLEFVELLNHEKPEVRMLVEARMNAASSLEETRTKRFKSLAALPGSTINIPLAFSGAHTHRFSGQDSLNLQNLPRKSLLRSAIRAPKGKKLVVVDASQIEARIIAWLSGCMELLRAFANKEDVYSLFATKAFGFPVNKKDHVNERFVGKGCILGLGFMSGKSTLYKSLVLGAQQYGMDLNITLEQAGGYVDTYRTSYPEIPALWKACDDFIYAMAAGVDKQLGPFSTDFSTHIAPGMVIPGGIPIRYPNLHRKQSVVDGRRKTETLFWRHRYKCWRSLYGGALTENMVQHLAWDVITNAMAKMWAKNPEWLCVLQCHDELGYLADDDEAQECYESLMGFICEQPDWVSMGPKLVALPLDAEGGIGETYAEAK